MLFLATMNNTPRTAALASVAKLRAHLGASAHVAPADARGALRDALLALLSAERAAEAVANSRDEQLTLGGYSPEQFRRGYFAAARRAVGRALAA